MLVLKIVLAKSGSDKTGVDLQGRAGKIMGSTNVKEQPHRVITGTKEHITVLPCFKFYLFTSINLSLEQKDNS